MNKIITTIALMLMPVTTYADGLGAWVQSPEGIITLTFGSPFVTAGIIFLVKYLIKKLEPLFPLFLQKFFAFMDKVFLTPLVSFCTRYSVKILFSLSLLLISPVFYAVTTPSAFTIAEASINSIFNIIEIFAVGLFIFFLMQKRYYGLCTLHEYTQAKIAYDKGNYDLAFIKAKFAAEKGDPSAQNLFALMLSKGRGVPKDEKEAVKWYSKAAEQGYAIAQNNLGLMYELGKGVAEKDEKEAVKWYNKSAEQGYARAQFNLGDMYEFKKGVPEDFEEAIKLYRKSAEQGYARAQYRIGWAYEGNMGVKKDYDEAVKWYHKSAERGYVDAQYRLGNIYSEGLMNFKKDYIEAVKWYRKAAEQGDAAAQCNLGAMYETERGVPKDEEEMAKWYYKSAKQGEGAAQYNVGAMHSRKEGEGLPNNITIYKWYTMAKINGYKEAQKELDKLKANGMSEKDMEEAKKLAQRCIDSNYRDCGND